VNRTAGLITLGMSILLLRLLRSSSASVVGKGDGSLVDGRLNDDFFQVSWLSSLLLCSKLMFYFCMMETPRLLDRI